MMLAWLSDSLVGTSCIPVQLYVDMMQADSRDSSVQEDIGT